MTYGLDNFENCDSIYTLDTSFADLASNLLYARWMIRKGNNEEAKQVLDSLVKISSDNGLKDLAFKIA